MTLQQMDHPIGVQYGGGIDTGNTMGAGNQEPTHGSKCNLLA